MQKTLFIGSSSEALAHAEQIAALLRTPDTSVELWTGAFRPGLLTFQAIEERSRNLSGAILLASPDDSTEIKSEKVKVPRTNVMIEFGYMCAILGRERVALCRYDDAYLATDLAGFTFIPMGSFAASNGGVVHGGAIRQLLEWTRGLPTVAEGVDYNRVLHGYTGTWEVRVVFERWRNIDLLGANYVEVNAKMDLFLPRDGLNGHGCVHGNLTIQVQDCTAEFKVTDRISAVTCESNGAIRFHSEMHNRQQVFKHGTEPQKDGFQEEITGPFNYNWYLSPFGVRELRGEYTAQAGSNTRSRAKVFARRVTA